MSIIHDVLYLTVYVHTSLPHLRPSGTIHYETRTVSKPAVCILLEYFLVHAYISENDGCGRTRKSCGLM